MTFDHPICGKDLAFRAGTLPEKEERIAVVHDALSELGYALVFWRDPETGVFQAYAEPDESA